MEKIVEIPKIKTNHETQTSESLGAAPVCRVGGRGGVRATSPCRIWSSDASTTAIDVFLVVQVVERTIGIPQFADYRENRRDSRNPGCPESLGTGPVRQVAIVKVVELGPLLPAEFSPPLFVMAPVGRTILCSGGVRPTCSRGSSMSLQHQQFLVRHVLLWLMLFAPTPVDSCAAPTPVVEFVYPTPSFPFAALAPVAEFVDPTLAVTYAASALALQVVDPFSRRCPW